MKISRARWRFRNFQKVPYFVAKWRCSFRGYITLNTFQRSPRVTIEHDGTVMTTNKGTQKKLSPIWPRIAKMANKWITQDSLIWQVNLYKILLFRYISIKTKLEPSKKVFSLIKFAWSLKQLSLLYMKSKMANKGISQIPLFDPISSKWGVFTWSHDCIDSKWGYLGTSYSIPPGVNVVLKVQSITSE